MGHFKWGVGTGCCGCNATELPTPYPCDCCFGALGDISFTPYIMQPFTGPHASQDGGTFWYNPDPYVVPANLGHWSHANAYELLAGGTRHTVSGGLYNMFFNDSFDTNSYGTFNTYNIGYNSGVGSLGVSTLVATDPGSSSFDIVNNCYAAGVQSGPTVGANYVLGPFSHVFPPGASCTNFLGLPFSPINGLLSGNVKCVVASYESFAPAGSSFYSWKDYSSGAGVDTGEKLYSTRATVFGEPSVWSTGVGMYAWVGKALNYNGLDECRLHVVVATSTAHKCVKITSGDSIDFTTYGRDAQTIYGAGDTRCTNMAYWRSSPLTQYPSSATDCCNLPDNINCTLVAYGNNMIPHRVMLYDYNPLPLTLRFLNLWCHGAAIRPDSTISVGLNFNGC